MSFESVDFFRDESLVPDPYPYFDALRQRCPAVREPHHDVVLVTGYDEAVAVYNDAETFSSCNAVTGPFPGFPVPLEGDDVSALIEEHRDELPFSDQLPTLDPPVHTAHRALLMRLITPKRLKENQEFMWRLADRVIDEFVADGNCDLIRGYGAPFTMLVIADLLGVPEEDHDVFRAELGVRPDRAIGNTERDTLAHSPLEFLYGQFTTYIEDRRRVPRDDVMTGLATATFPDGSTPGVMDVVRIASNLFAAGQETTVRLLGAALQLIAERPDLQALLAGTEHRSPRSSRRRSGSRARSRATSAWHGYRRGSGTSPSLPARRSWSSTAPPIEIRATSRTRPPSTSTVRTPVSTWRSASASTPAPARRSHAQKGASASSGWSTGSATSGSRKPRTARPAPGATSTSPR